MARNLQQSPYFQEFEQLYWLGKAFLQILSFDQEIMLFTYIQELYYSQYDAGSLNGGGGAIYLSPTSILDPVPFVEASMNGGSGRKMWA